MKKIIVPIVCLALVVGILSGCTETPTNEAPVASFTVTDPIYVDTEITFTDTSTDDSAVASWAWDFGDEETSTEQNPKHTYTEVGDYTVTLTVTDDEDETSEAYTMDISVVLKDIVTTAIDAGFSTLATALTAADLVETLQGEGPFTVFAPTDDAFAALNQTWLTNLLADTTNLTKVLTYHVVSGTYLSGDLTDGNVETLEGTNVTIAIEDSVNVTVNGVLVTTADIECSNGVIHIIGEVLLPASVAGPE